MSRTGTNCVPMLGPRSSRPCSAACDNAAVSVSTKASIFMITFPSKLGYGLCCATLALQNLHNDQVQRCPLVDCAARNDRYEDVS